jgi:peptidoglycan/xylan/chitin deacetylase (PgdA/CDA1 family)
MRFENGMFIVSVDVDVGCKLVGEINKGKNDINVHDHLSESVVGEIEELALPLFIRFFDDLEIPVTFALRGQLTEVKRAPILELLLQSSVEHDIGSHGYYHTSFANLSKARADMELGMISVGMKALGITPRSFVFPRNHVAHLCLLEKHGYKCYRDNGGSTLDGMYVERRGQLYDIHPSFYLGQSVNPIFLNKIVDIAIKKKLPFHVWFHPWNFGETRESIERSISRVFVPLFMYAKEKQKKGLLTFETMLSAANAIGTHALT